MTEDKAMGSVLAKAPQASSPPDPSPLIRAMTNTLLDHDVDLSKDIEIITTLLRAGFTADQINTYFNAAVTMALIRDRNQKR